MKEVPDLGKPMTAKSISGRGRFEGSRATSDSSPSAPASACLLLNFLFLFLRRRSCDLLRPSLMGDSAVTTSTAVSTGFSRASEADTPTADDERRRADVAAAVRANPRRRRPAVVDIGLIMMVFQNFAL